jgi:hypothetical protein
MRCGERPDPGREQSGAEFDTETFAANRESIRNNDLGIGALLSLGGADHQASHKIRGTALRPNRNMPR